MDIVCVHVSKVERQRGRDAEGQICRDAEGQRGRYVEGEIDVT